jgi:hypothetical protein
MSISALTDFIAVSGLIGSALYDDKNRENFSQRCDARRGIAEKPVEIAEAVLVVHALITLFIVGGLAAI